MNTIAWFDQQDANKLFITTITIAEISYGLRALPAGNRRNALEIAFHDTVIEAFEYRILRFDEPAAYRYGQIMTDRKKIGRPLSILDGQIAAIAHIHGFAVATRNTCDFSDCGLDLVNPFL